MKRKLASAGMGAALACFALLLVAPSAPAHGGLEAEVPEAGARVKKVPNRVSMTFSEVPARDSVMKVIDGCKRAVVADTSVSGNDLVGRIAEAQPGKWKASYRVISAEDGHLTKGRYSFTVAGDKDCNPDGGGDGNGGDATETAAPEPPGDATGAEDDGQSFPVVPVAVGAAGLVIVGLVVRRASGG